MADKIKMRISVNGASDIMVSKKGNKFFNVTDMNGNRYAYFDKDENKLESANIWFKKNQKRIIEVEFSNGFINFEKGNEPAGLFEAEQKSINKEEALIECPHCKNNFWWNNETAKARL